MIQHPKHLLGKDIIKIYIKFLLRSLVAHIDSLII